MPLPAYLVPSFSEDLQARLWRGLTLPCEEEVRAVVLSPGFPGAELRTMRHELSSQVYLTAVLDFVVSSEDPRYPPGILEAFIEAGALPKPGTLAAEQFQVTHLRHSYLSRERGMALVRRFDQMGLPLNGQADGETLLSIAAEDGNFDWTDALLQAGADPRIGKAAWTIEPLVGDYRAAEVRACGALCKQVALALDRQAALQKHPASVRAPRRTRS